MPTTANHLVTAVRSASRTMVRELGFMRPTLAATDYPPSAVHSLLELQAHGSLTAAQLVGLLGLEKSSVSRMLAKLEAAGEIEPGTASDARAKPLCLTARGHNTVAAIQAYGQQQVQAALHHLSPAQQQTVAQGLSTYARALQASREEKSLPSPTAIEIHAGYRPGLLGRVTEMHACFYARHAGFGQFFESQVAGGLAEFAGRLGQDGNQIWCATLHGHIVGAIAIDGQDLGGQQAHLRWFILDDGCRGLGVGQQLLRTALAFCDAQGFVTTQLWTFAGLDAARHLYEAQGFTLVHEATGSQWGSAVTEQQFSRPRPLATCP
jgi:DNA-binding MarR family transcriptional regulator/ribosomal protein S18 acetylase RimI-like enzyme